MGEFDVRPNDPSLPYGALCGGNQQKALLAKWFQTEPTLLLLHEPTQGVDVGARQQIFELIRTAARSGNARALRELRLRAARGALRPRHRLRPGPRLARAGGAEVTKERIIEQCYNACRLSHDHERLDREQTSRRAATPLARRARARTPARRRSRRALRARSLPGASRSSSSAILQTRHVPDDRRTSRRSSGSQAVISSS